MIRLQQISRIFKVGGQDVHALDTIDLHVSAGEYLSVMGPSGSGKSTLLNIIGLLDSPTRGSYTLDGHDVTSLNDDDLALVRREKIGFIFQFFHLVPRLTARQNIELPLLLAGVNSRERTRRSNKVIEDFGLVDRAHHLPEELSGGQRQRVAIARAVINKPAVLLADEPTGNLDQRSGTEIVQLLEQLNADGITLIVVTHDVEIGSRANRYVKFVDGRIVSDVREKKKEKGRE
jgi:putative ABC transport system ATP-binding protein